MCFCFRSSLPGASSAADALPGSIVFLLDPTPYRVTRCNSNSDSLLVFPAVGNKRSSFLALKSTVWSPPKPLQSLAVNTEPMECNVPLSPSPLPPPILLDTADVGVLTSPVPTSTVSCYTDSFADLEFAAFLKENEEIDCLQQSLAATRAELGK